MITFSIKKPKHLGVTSPLSLAYATKKDTLLSIQLEQLLESMNMFETEAELAKRLVITTLQK